MKNFTVYSKAEIKKPLKLKEILDIRYIKQGVRLAFLFDITGIAYAFSRKLYKLAFALILLMILFEVLFNYFPEYEKAIFVFKTMINASLFLFANEVEEFFLKRKGYKAQSIIFAKNEKSARFILEEEIKLNLKR